MQYFTREYAPSSINVIPTSSEKCFSFQIGNLRFLDSLQFLSASLDVLVKNLITDGRNNLFHTTPDASLPRLRPLLFQGCSLTCIYGRIRDIFLKWITCHSAFCSSLTEKIISEAEYVCAQKVWQEFVNRHMRDYHDRCLILDVLLLVDVLTISERLALLITVSIHVITTHFKAHFSCVSNIHRPRTEDVPVHRKFY